MAFLCGLPKMQKYHHLRLPPTPRRRRCHSHLAAPTFFVVLVAVL